MPRPAVHASQAIDDQWRPRSRHRLRRIEDRPCWRPETPVSRTGAHAGAAVDHEQDTRRRVRRVDGEDLGH
eukprot:12577300-Heterocapsa_arctica.AAC.1